MSLVPSTGLLSRVIDDYMLWLVGWCRANGLSTGGHEEALQAVRPPASFDVWRMTAIASMNEQPAVEKLVDMHDQLHTFARMALMRTPDDQPVSGMDSDGVLARYWELMQAMRRYERALATAASNLDPLTGLRTRAGMLRDLQREISRYDRMGRSFCVVAADIDHFKAINDKYGHETGDKVLAAVADHITRCLRGHDDAFRIGGEEFLLCLRDADLSAGLSALERLRKSLKDRPVGLLDGTTVPITLSFGLAPYNLNVEAEDLLRHADKALYRAKHEGRDRIIVAD